MHGVPVLEDAHVALGIARLAVGLALDPFARDHLDQPGPVLVRMLRDLAAGFDGDGPQLHHVAVQPGLTRDHALLELAQGFDGEALVLGRAGHLCKGETGGQPGQAEERGGEGTNGKGHLEISRF
ncbi:hypothetical protein Salmuc_01450 [Salipiger mucosus DSM 16094]|uniref:Uncharacterized protein n=1 Tax=Salipiger mucosus DSM 16094 TaxID=1123237 RepID=S9QZI5_9RHOB|nr:hypothetical protein Salmuc_01450 [Salipiger mucosus DSM 16094]